MATDIGQTCRLCLDSANNGTSTSIDDEAFRSKLSALSDLTFDNEDHFPSKVCPECCHKVTEFYEFVETVRKNQKQLREEHSNITKEPIKNDPGVESESETLKTVKKQISNDADDADDEHQMFYVEVDPPEDDEDDEDDDKDFDPSEMDHDDNMQDGDDSNRKRLRKPNSEDKAKTLAEEDRLIREHFTLQCETCTETFQTWRELAHHSKKVHNKNATLQCCNKTFQRKFNILYHINSHRKPCQCEMCGKSFADKYSLNFHIAQKHTSIEEKPFKCDQCSQSFLKQHLLKSHLKWHVQVECQFCHRMLSNEYSLKTHIQNKHTPSDGFVCATCGQHSPSRYALDAHLKKHSDQPQEMAPCPECHKLFIKKYLPIHIRNVHHGKQVTCEICSKVFPYKRALATHKSRVHVRQMIGCDICGKQYKKQLHLKEHMASHAGVKLYACDVCGMEMNSMANLYNHRKNKHPAEWLLWKQRKSDGQGGEDK